MDTTRGTSRSLPPTVALAAVAYKHQQLATVVQEVLDAYHRSSNAVEFADAFSKHAFALQRLVWNQADHEQGA